MITLLHPNPDEAQRFLSRYRQTFPLEAINRDDQIWSCIDRRILQMINQAPPKIGNHGSKLQRGAGLA